MYCREVLSQYYCSSALFKKVQKVQTVSNFSYLKSRNWSEKAGKSLVLHAETVELGWSPSRPQLKAPIQVCSKTRRIDPTVTTRTKPG